MKVLILGMDGYLGWALACDLFRHGHDIVGVDNGSRRKLVKEAGSVSAIPIDDITTRIKTIEQTGVKGRIEFQLMNIVNEYDRLHRLIYQMQPDVIYHLAQMPSAPYSMKSREICLWTMQNNMFGTLNVLYAMRDASRHSHLIKIGTMGEYGTPNCPIPEGEVTIEIDGHVDSLPFPRAAGSWYHQTKVHDTHNIRMACKQWGLRCTDVMQGIVYGCKVEGMYNDSRLNTRLDFDQYFGTIINRFVVQAVLGHPLTVYGTGFQIRSILPLQDSINCLNLIALSPPSLGTYRELNQFQEYLDLTAMATIVSGVRFELTGSYADIRYYQNPRIEQEGHFYKPKREWLHRMGYRPSERIEKVVRCMMSEVMKNESILTVYREAIIPTVRWSGDNRAVQTIGN